MAKNEDRIKFTDEDPKLKLLVKRRGLGEESIKNYNNVFNEIYENFNLTPSQIVEIGKKDQKPYKTDDGLFDILDLEDRKVTELQTNYLDFLVEQENNENTQKLKIELFRALLGEYDIQKPKSSNIKIKKDRIRESDIISWRDVEKAMDISKGLREKCILSFLATTGLRGIDMIGLDIQDLVSGCKIYFDEDEEHNIDNLLKKDPKSIIPCYELMPSKTEDKSQLAMTFNTPECSEYLWQYLKERIDKKGELKPTDPLFVNKHHRRIKIGSLEKMFQRLNKQLGNQKDKNGKYGKFRKHSMRKLFSTTCRKNILNITLNSDRTTEMDILSIFTGHVPPNESNAKAYEAIPDDSEDSYLREIYFKLVPYLSIKDTEVHHINSKEVTELTEKIEILETQNQQKDIAHQRDMDEKDKEIAELKAQLQQTTKIVKDLDKKIDQSRTNIPFHKVHDVIFNYLSDIGELNQDRISLLNLMVLDYAKKHPKEFKTTPEYLYDLIKRLDIQIELSNKDVLEQKDELAENMEFEKIDPMMVSIIDELLTIIKDNEGVMKRIGDVDMIKFDYVAEEYLVELDLDYSEYISDDDKIKMANEILMKYMKS